MRLNKHLATGLPDAYRTQSLTIPKASMRTPSFSISFGNVHFKGDPFPLLFRKLTNQTSI